MITPLQVSLSKIFDTNNWKLKLLKNWKSIVGPLHLRMRIEKFQEANNALVIGVYESHWIQELFLLSNILKKNINKFLEKDYIKVIKFKLVEKKNKIKKNKLETTINSKQKFDLDFKQKSALNKIQDDQLRKVLTNFLAKCLKS